MERNLKTKTSAKKDQHIVIDANETNANVLKFPSPKINFTDPYFIEEPFEGKMTLERVYLDEYGYETDADVVELSFKVAGESCVQIPGISLGIPANNNNK